MILKNLLYKKIYQAIFTLIIYILEIEERNKKKRNVKKKAAKETNELILKIQVFSFFCFL